jgi:hypothetical protein
MMVDGGSWFLVESKMLLLLPLQLQSASVGGPEGNCLGWAVARIEDSSTSTLL